MKKHIQLHVRRIVIAESDGDRCPTKHELGAVSCWTGSRSGTTYSRHCDIPDVGALSNDKRCHDHVQRHCQCAEGRQRRARRELVRCPDHASISSVPFGLGRFGYMSKMASTNTSDMPALASSSAGFDSNQWFDDQ